MSTVNLAVPGGSHSQLATNRVLIALGNVFSLTAFTSRDVSNMFSLDFLYTAKKLSYMSGKSCNLLSVRKVARVYGGLENEYTISPHGWSKINYLQRRKSAPAKEPSRRGSFATASYLLAGYGNESDVFKGPLLKHLFGEMSSPFDEIGLLLSDLNPQILVGEGIFANDEHLITLLRCTQLQNLGLIPQDIDLTTFIPVAFGMGAPSSSIIISLLVRGGIKQRNELNITKISSAIESKTVLLQRVTQHSSSSQLTTQHASSIAGDVECEKCHDNERSIQDVKRSHEEIRFERNSLEIKNAFLERDIRVLNLQLELSEARRQLLQDNNLLNAKCLGILAKELEKFELPLEAMPVKSFVYTGLAALVLLNYEAFVASSP